MTPNGLRTVGNLALPRRGEPASMTDLGLSAPSHGAHRVLVITGSYGAGHDSAAHEIRWRLAEAGWDVDVLDIADMYPLKLGRIIKRAYFTQLALAPRSWSWLLDKLDSHGGQATRMGAATTAASGRLPAKKVAAAVTSGTVCVISTHPFASQTLGYLRRRGMLDIPTVTYLTDGSVHPLWIHPSVDAHIAIHEEAARQARARGARDVRVIHPLTPAVGPPDGDERRRFRTQLGLAAGTQVALISGGSTGAGDVRTAARDVRNTGVATPVVLCGRNDRLRRKLDREPGIVAVGWLDGLTDAIRASDCVIQNSGGFTTLESLAVGIPLISYRCLPGHGDASARALQDELGVPWPKTTLALRLAIDKAIAAGTGAPPRSWRERPTLLDGLRLSAPTSSTR